LYSPLYAERPTVVPELYSSLRPQVYEQDLRHSMTAGKSARQSRSALPREEQTLLGTATTNASARPGSAMRGEGGQAGGLGGAINDAYAVPSDDDNGVNIQGSAVSAAAQADDVGELFQYEIEAPVTLARQTSAMLPIINGAIEGSKVSIYNASTHAKHPLNGIRAKNTSDLHLMQGPITVYDDGVYAGDARLPDLPPGAERLLSYALDLDVEVAPTSDAKPQQLASAKIDKGVLTAVYKQTRRQSYAVKNSGDVAKTVLIEYPVESRWKLVEPKEPAEKTRNAYRFSVVAKPDESARLVISEEQIVRQRVELLNPFSDNTEDAAGIQVFLSSEELSEEIKEALREVVKRNTEIAELRRTKAQLDHETAAIGEEQQRIRPNMEAIDRNTDLYNRYVKKLSDQEDQIEKLRAEAKSLDDKISGAQASLDEYVSSLNLP
jgi:hypothetical protein